MPSGGVLVIPTYEETGTKEAQQADAQEFAIAEATEVPPEAEPPITTFDAHVRRRDTRTLINRAVARLIRAGGRRTEADALHLLQGIAVLVYDPDSGSIDPQLPPIGSGLRWNEFIDALVAAYEARFEENFGQKECSLGAMRRGSSAIWVTLHSTKRVGDAEPAVE